MNRVIFLIVLLLAIGGCRMLKGITTPYFMGTTFRVPPGTPAFQQGYRDGCKQLIYSRGNAFYRWRHKYRYNIRLKGNPEYRLGQRRGLSFCFNFTVPGIKSADASYLLLDKNPILAKNYNATSGIFDGLNAPIPKAKNGGLNGVFQVWGGSGGNSVFGANPLWAGGSKTQFFGQ